MAGLAEFAERTAAALSTQNMKVKALEERVEELKGVADAQKAQFDRAIKTVQFGSTGAGPLPGRVLTKDEAVSFARFVQAVHDPAKRAEYKDFTMETDADGRIFIPETFQSRIINLVESVGRLQALCQEVPLGPGKNHWPRATTAPTVYWLGAGKAITDSEPGTGGIDMTPEILAGLCHVPRTNMVQASAPLGEFLIGQFARAIAKEEERVMLSGTGIAGDGKITGILQSSNVTIVNMGSGDTAFSNLDYSDLIDMEMNVIDPVLEEARYVLSGYTLGLVKKLGDDVNRPIWQQAAGNEPNQINGHGYSRINQMPGSADSAVSTPFLIFGGLRDGVWYGRPGGMAIETSIEHKFAEHMMSFKLVEQFAAQVIPGSETGKNPLAVLKTAAS